MRCWHKGAVVSPYVFKERNLISPRKVAEHIVMLVASICQEAQPGKNAGIVYVTGLNERCYRRLVDGVVKTVMSLVECEDDEDYIKFEREVRKIIELEAWDLRLHVPVYRSSGSG